MTKEKWEQINREESKRVKMMDSMKPNPENWKFRKSVLEDYIKAMDEATEVYEMENKK